MRHRKQRSKLSMQTARRDATLRNMVKSLILHQRITMTLGRAKVARRLAENVIHMTKTDSVVSRRKAYDILQDRDLVMKLFKEIGPLFKNRTSGYTRILTPDGIFGVDGQSDRRETSEEGEEGQGRSQK
ncbi:MAG: 50S ribosomal protein L17 [Candidatus Omnitrophica bacterium]|nr:50S ribosomal protein L17 [Candidatus Omnitrophota bacterium]